VTRACVIGAGFGGLALAIRLQSSGVETVLIEARDVAGGQSAPRERSGFRFDSGPAALSDHVGLAELWQLSGKDIEDDVTWLPVDPIRRVSWPDGSQFDIPGGEGAEAAVRREVARISPDDAAGYENFLRWADHARRDGAVPWLVAGTKEIGALVHAAPMLVRHQAWRSAYGIIASYVKNERLREVIAVSALAEGINPMAASAFHALQHRQELLGGRSWPKGGMAKLADTMVAHFTTLGGRIVLHDPVLHIHTLGDRAGEVECVSGWRERFDAVASSADAIHTYRDLLASNPRGAEVARDLRRRSFAPSQFTVYFGLEGSWPGIPHDSVLLPMRFKPLMDDIFEHGVLPRDFVMFLNHPSVTDPSVAPRGKSLFRATIPVANQARLPIDWDQAGPLIERRILDEVGRRLIHDIDDRIVVKFHTSPRDLALDYNAWAGSTAGFEATMAQALWPPLGARDAKLRNLWFAGANAQPGGGFAGALVSARMVAKRMIEETR
jgi:phytoene desaturase